LAAPQRSLAATKSAGMSPGVADRGSAPRKSRCGGGRIRRAVIHPSDG
jgi:hypothetical protein